MGDDRDQLARDLIGCFPVLDKSDRSAADAWPGPTELAAEVERLRADLVVTRVTLLLTESERRNYRENIEWLRAHLAAAEAERDRRGDELQRAQAVIDAAKAWRDAIRDAPDDDDLSWADDPYLTIAHSLYAAVAALEASVPP